MRQDFLSARLVAQLNKMPREFFQEERLARISKETGERIVRGWDIKEGTINAYSLKTWQRAYPNASLTYE